MKYFFGVIEDNVGLLNVHWVPVPLSSSEPILYHFYFFLAKYIDSIYLYNIFLLTIFTLNFIFIFKFLKLFDFSNLQVFLSTLIISTSTYFSYHFRSHLALINIWVLVYFLIILFSSNFNVKNYYLSFKAGVIIAFCSLISNYLGFFGLLVLFIYLLIQLFFSFYSSSFNYKNLFLNYFIIFLTFSIFFISFNINYLSELRATQNRFSSNYDLLTRNVGNFFIFTSRPWYYLLPSSDNLIFGKISENILSFIEINWGNYLTKNYFKSEHSASFLGFTNLFFGITGLYYLFKIKIFKNEKEEYNFENTKLYSIFLITLILILFTMPPFINFKGFNIYFPSYLIYETFPMFRVLARLGIIILIFWFIFVNYGYLYFVKKFNLDKNNTLKKIFFVCIVFLSINEFFIPFKITNVSNPPEVYKYLKSLGSVNERIFIYPENKTTEAYFWKLEHKMDVINFGTGNYIDNTFYSKDLITQKSSTCEGISLLKKMDVKFIIYFKNKEPNKQIQEFFNKNLVLIKSFDNEDIEEIQNYKILTLINTGNIFMNEANIYEISSDKVKNCID